MSVTRPLLPPQPAWPSVGGLMPVSMVEGYFDLAVSAVQIQRTVVVQVARATTTLSSWPAVPLRSAFRWVRKSPATEDRAPVLEIGRPYQHWSRRELQDELRIRGLSGDGTPAQLRARIVADDLR